MTDSLDALPRHFADRFGRTAAVVSRAPGRVNLIGEHTDYNDGFVLPAAIGVETRVAMAPRADDRIEVAALDIGETASWRLTDALPPAGEGHWSQHVRGMIAMVRREGLAVPGLDIALSGTVPQGAGLSSSASLAVALGMALFRIAGAGADKSRIAQLAQASEIEAVGTNCGIMDQLVSARGEAGHALMIDCRSLDCRPVRLPAGVAIMIVHSGISRGLVEGAYNERRAQCEAVATALGVPALRDADMAMLNAAAERLDPMAMARARHVITENARVLEAAGALAAGDLARMGVLMATSHASMRDDFAITTPAIDELVALLQRAIGSEGGARMTGGGFGGACVALMPEAQVASVAQAVRAGYRTPDGGEPLIMIERASEGASILRADQAGSA
jgi:galactokinase